MKNKIPLPPEPPEPDYIKESGFGGCSFVVIIAVIILWFILGS